MIALAGAFAIVRVGINIGRMSQPKRFALHCAQKVAGGLALVVAVAVHAQLPGLPGPGLGLGLESKKPATTVTVASDPESQTLRLQKRATSLAAEIAQLEAPGGLGVGAPPGTSEVQLTERLSVVQFTPTPSIKTWKSCVGSIP
ncbi:MAG: hypothetical protein RR758_00385 [Burkholderiaceae bacterium]